MVEAGSCPGEVASREQVAQVDGKTAVPSPSAAPSASSEVAAPAPAEPAADSFHAQSPAAFSSSVHSPACVAKRLFACSVTAPALTSARSASQSRQKSGETQGFCAMRRSLVRRNWLIEDMADVRSSSRGSRRRRSAPPGDERTRGVGREQEVRRSAAASPKRLAAVRGWGDAIGEDLAVLLGGKKPGTRTLTAPVRRHCGQV